MEGTVSERDQDRGIVREIAIRRARRALDPRDIDEAVLDRILTAARWAPSCFNNQPWRLLVASEETALAKVKEQLSGGNYWAKQSPTIVVVAAKLDDACQLSDRRDYALFDCGLAVENMMLQAFSEGVIAHAIAGYNPEGIKAAFGIPEEYIVITLVVLGYPGPEEPLNEKHRALEHAERVRKDAGDVLFFDAWR